MLPQVKRIVECRPIKISVTINARITDKIYLGQTILEHKDLKLLSL